MPLWAQLHHELRRRLDSGEFGERFPTDLELVNEYGVSRHTVRHAIGQLNATGVLTRERGRGTVVNKAEFEQSLGALYSLFESVEHTGVEQRSEVLQLTVASSDEARSHLELDHDDEMVLLERLRLAGDDPLAVDRAWLPATIARPLLTVDFTHTALYDELEVIGETRPDRGWERIAPVMPSPADRNRLNLRRNDAAFSLERLGYAGDRPIEWRNTLIRGDRFRFVADWSVAGRADMRLDHVG